MVFSIFQANKKAKSAEVNANFAFIAGGRLIAFNSSTGAAIGTFPIGDLTAITNGSLAGSLLARSGEEIKVYNSSGALIGSITYDELLNLQSATESQEGVAEIADQSETDAGTDDTRFITPLKLKNATSIFKLATAQASTGGAAIDFTGIPAGVNKISIMLSEVSTNGTSNVIIQLGAGSVQTSGYLGAGSNYIGTPAVSNVTNGLAIESTTTRSAAKVRHGIATFERINGDAWVGTWTGAYSNDNEMSMGATSVTLSGTLDRVRITTAGGANTFDAGTINIQYS
jgi:hypothetical protein